VVDPRRNATADKADLFLQVKPGSDLALLNGLLHLLHAEGKTDPPFIAAHTQGWEAMPDFLADYPPPRWPRSPASPRRICAAPPP
jgi:anaerobic selenocysteine-containing dehydrogenase